MDIGQKTALRVKALAASNAAYALLLIYFAVIPPPYYAPPLTFYSILLLLSVASVFTLNAWWLCFGSNVNRHGRAFVLVVDGVTAYVGALAPFLLHMAERNFEASILLLPVLLIGYAIMLADIIQIYKRPLQ